MSSPFDGLCSQSLLPLCSYVGAAAGKAVPRVAAGTTASLAGGPAPSLNMSLAMPVCYARNIQLGSMLVFEPGRWKRSLFWP